MDELIFFVNGQRQVLKEPSKDLTLLTYIRRHLGLSGTKLGCGEGGCGACTVTVSKYSAGGLRHFAINACITKVCALFGCHVSTVEFIGSTRTGLHPVQERLYRCHGSQCGFCSPGMVMSMHSLLKQHPTPDIEDVNKCLQGNLCRCTGYRPILEAFSTFCSDEAALGEIVLGEGEEVLHVDPKTFKKYVPRTDDPKIPDEIVEMRGVQGRFHDAEGHVWYSPTTFEELRDLQKNLDHDFELFGGGTGSYQMMDKKRPKNAPYLIQTTRIEELKYVSKTGSRLKIGAASTLTEAMAMIKDMKEENQGVSAVYDALSWIGSSQVRNVATIGGCIMWGHGCSDLMPVLMALDAEVEILSKGVLKAVSVHDELMVSGLDEKDVITSLVFSVPDSSWKTRYFRMARKKDFDLPIANACFHVKIEGSTLSEVRIAIGGGASTFPSSYHEKPRLATTLMSTLKGQPLANCNKKNLETWLAREKFLHVDQTAPGYSAELRKSLILDFLLRFLDNDVADDTREKCPRKSVLTYQKPVEDQPDVDPVTRPIPHMWAAEQASGEAIYVDDLPAYPNEVQIVPLQSTRPHAKIVRMDFSEALDVPGVIGKMTAEDLTERSNRWGAVVHDEPIFAWDEVMYHGQIIGVLVCTNLAAGKKARKLVKVEYEELSPAILSIEDAVKLNSSILPAPLKLTRDQGDEGSDLKANANANAVLDGSVHLSGQEMFYMETHGALVCPSTEKDEMTVYSSTQGLSGVQRGIANLLGVPQHKITVNIKRVGGGFGGKERTIEAYIAALVARKYGRPARFIYGRREDMETTGHRHELTVKYKVDYNEAGQLCKTNFDCMINAGATSDLSMIWGQFLLTRLDGGYTLRRFSGQSMLCKTNTQSNTAFRGFGGPEAITVIEQVMDRVAKALGKDPDDVRLANMTKEGDKLHYGSQVITGCTLPECWNECAKRSRYNEKKLECRKFNSENDRVKRAVSMVPIKYSSSFENKIYPQAVAFVRIYVDGSVLLSHGGVEMGQGLNTKMIQVASKVLQIDSKKVHITETSTSTTVNASPTGGSTGSDLNGAAVIDACEQLKARLRPYEEQNPSGAWEDWVQAAYLDRVSLSAVGFYGSSPVDFDFSTNTGVATSYYTYGVGAFEVEVNCCTGQVTLLSVHFVMDVGRSLNPAIDIGQIEGGLMQAFGYVTTEQLLIDPSNGKLLTGGPSHYKIPTAVDVPQELCVHLLRNDHGPASSVYSSKGIGEPPMVLSTGGLVLAIHRAIHEFRRANGIDDWFHIDVPATPDKVRGWAVGADVRKLVFDTKKIAIEV